MLDIATELGYRLAMNGAETFRIEDSINRVIATYGIKAESFAIPNCLHVSIETAEGKPMTRMRRIGLHGNDLDAVEKYSNLSRRICQDRPELHLASQWLNEANSTERKYGLPMHLLGNLLGAAGFSVLFGGSWRDSLCAASCGLVVGLINKAMEKLNVNQFFRIITTSFFMGLVGYLAGALKFSDNADTAIIGALMILVPGLIFTNAMRDIIYGDTNSGINRIIHVFLIAVAIALGTGIALNITDSLLTVPSVTLVQSHSLLIESVACFIACIGFVILFNIHGPGGFLCALGGMITWLTYRIIVLIGGGDIIAYFLATMVASAYAECMARIRKYPAISYLVISIFPLIPGAGVYYTMNHIARGNMTMFAQQGTHTIAIAGAMAVGILLISTLFKLIGNRRNSLNRI